MDSVFLEMHYYLKVLPERIREKRFCSNKIMGLQKWLFGYIGIGF